MTTLIRMSSLNLTRLILLSVVSFFLATSLSAQCDVAPEAGVHVVKNSETLYKIAKRYNTSVTQLCQWNNISKNEALLPCQELVVSSVLLKPVPVSFNTSPKSPLGATKQSGKWHTVRQGETAASLAELYGYTEARFRDFNNIPAGRKIQSGSIVRSSECRCDAIKGAKELATTATPSAITTTTIPSEVAEDRGYMKLDESAMIDEINLMRANPKGYVKYVRQFVKDNNDGWGFPISTESVNSLIRDLEKSPKLSTLSPHKCLYELAQTHGDYLRATKRFDHMDAKGVGPWSRTKNACPMVKMSTSKGRTGMLVGNENLVAGYDNVREAVIGLLIDDGMSVPGHRETLLAPEWRYVACYNFGTVNQMKNNWVQNFAR